MPAIEPGEERAAFTVIGLPVATPYPANTVVPKPEAVTRTSYVPGFRLEIVYVPSAAVVADARVTFD